MPHTRKVWYEAHSEDILENRIRKTDLNIEDEFK